MRTGRFSWLPWAPAILAVLGLALPGAGGGPRLQSLPADKRPVGTTPVPTKRALAKYHKFVGKPVDPELTLEVVVDRPRLFPLKARPFRIQVGNARIVDYSLLNDKLLTIQGKAVGITVLYLWFGDPRDRTKQSVLRLQINVL
jgi:hypothetical protein